MTPTEQSQRARDICKLAPVVPVLVIEDLAHAAPLARALIAGGLPALEVTLRTPCALDAIGAMAQVAGGVVGAGTLLTPADVIAAKAAGAMFGVSPGATPALIAACEDQGLPLLPGGATASEIMALLERGYSVQKFFPAQQAGGADYLKSTGGPLPQVSFCPTGGISVDIAPQYLALKNILCVGGSWVAPKDAMARGDWGAIETLAREASKLARASA
jgi:2-dehydro-3-deoxyphosphogluconate aldolase / (4S)-4-hydroxy-2-oxoglutarate aldolase